MNNRMWFLSAEEIKQLEQLIDPSEYVVHEKLFSFGLPLWKVSILLPEADRLALAELITFE